jgi:hypothetical protein
MNADYTVQHHGNLCTVRPMTEAAREFLEDCVSDEAQWWCGALVVEPRYLADFVQNLKDDGAEVTFG